MVRPNRPTRAPRPPRQAVRGSGNVVVLGGRRGPHQAQTSALAVVEQPEDGLAWVDDLDTSNPPPDGPGSDAGIFRLLGYLIRLSLWRMSERLRGRASR